MVSSYNMNFHAWDPPDTRMASPIGGVWNALALVHLARGGAFSGVMYNVLAMDCLWEHHATQRTYIHVLERCGFFWRHRAVANESFELPDFGLQWFAILE